MTTTQPATQVPSRRAGQRGGAMVEFALLQIVLVPLMLYSIFLMDVPHLMLETQETVISTVWDFSTHNHEGGSGSPSDADVAGHITRINSVLWSDHNSAYEAGVYPDEDRYQDINWARGTPHEPHHVGFGAQYAFQFSNGPDTQLDCNMSNRDTLSFDSADYDSDLGWNNDPGFNAFAGSNLTMGGLGNCEVTAFIYNYIVPQTFLQEFSREDMTRMEYRNKDTPGQAGGITSHDWQGDTSAINNIPVRSEAAVAFNTWALRNGATNGNINNADLDQPPNNNPFMARVIEANSSGPQSGTWALAVAGGAAFSARAASEELMAVPALGVPLPGLPMPVAVYLRSRYQPESPGERQNAPGFGGERYETTPYEDVNPNYSTAASNRGNHYMGCDSAETYPCN